MESRLEYRRLHACLIFIPTVFVVHFCGGPSRKSQGSTAVFLFFLLFIFDKIETFKERGAVFKDLKQSNQDTSCITSISDTVKFVYEHAEAFISKSVLEIASLTGGIK